LPVDLEIAHQPLRPPRRYEYPCVLVVPDEPAIAYFKSKENPYRE